MYTVYFPELGCEHTEMFRISRPNDFIKLLNMRLAALEVPQGVTCPRNVDGWVATDVLVSEIGDAIIHVSNVQWKQKTNTFLLWPTAPPTLNEDLFVRNLFAAALQNYKGDLNDPNQISVVKGTVA
jgi:hypothetical protein